jgi:MORN repeat.
MMAEGGTYAGQFSDGDFDGEGTIFYHEGHEERHTDHHEGGAYTGQFVGGFRDGKGLWRSADGSRQYDGEWHYQVPHGEGVSERRGLPGGGRWIYEGEHVAGQPAGVGRCTYIAEPAAEAGGGGARETSEYVGEWGLNQREGVGRQTLSAGGAVVGRWESDVLLDGAGREIVCCSTTYEGALSLGGHAVCEPAARRA